MFIWRGVAWTDEFDPRRGLCILLKGECHHTAVLTCEVRRSLLYCTVLYCTGKRCVRTELPEYLAFPSNLHLLLWHFLNGATSDDSAHTMWYYTQKTLTVDIYSLTLSGGNPMTPKFIRWAQVGRFRHGGGDRRLPRWGFHIFTR